MLAFNLFLLATCLCLGAVVFYQFILQPIEDGKKFRLYKLRDELAFAAMKGQVSEESREYDFLMGMINIGINIYDVDFSVSSFLRSLVTPQLGKISETNFHLKKIQENPAIAPISNELLKILTVAFKRELKMLNILGSIIEFKPVKIILKSIYVLIIGQARARNVKTQSPKDVLTSMRSDLRKYNNEILVPANNRAVQMESLALCP